MLTHQQRRALLFIEAELDRTGGVSPSVREIAKHLGHKRTGSAQRLLVGLEERGFIHRRCSRARAITVVNPISRFAFLRFDDQSKTLRPYASPVNAETART